VNDQAARQPRLSGMRAFYVLWGGQFVSIFASQMTSFAVTLWAWDLSGSATTLVLVGLASFLPRMFLSPLAGTLVDRWNRKLVMALSDAGAAVATVILLAVFITGSAQLWHLFLAGVLMGGFGAFQYPATTAVISTMVTKDQYSRANSLQSLTGSAAGVGAPLIAGGLVAWIGISGILFIDLATFLIALASLLIVHIPQPSHTGESETGRGTILSETRRGFQYVVARPSLVSLFLVFMVSNFAAGFITPMVNPMVLARTSDNAAILGLVRAAGAFGYLSAGLIMLIWKGPKRKINGVAIGFVLEGAAAAILLGAGRSPVAWMLGFFIAGLSITMLNNLYLAILQAKIAQDIQGRVFGIEYLTTTASYPVGQVVAGLASDRLFEPAMGSSGVLADDYGWLVGTTPGSGTALVIMIGGLLCIAIGEMCYLIGPVREIESLLPDHPEVDQAAA